MGTSVVPSCLFAAIDAVYLPAGLKCSEDISPDVEAREYGGCRFMLGTCQVVFRVAKTTPTKIGQLMPFGIKLVIDHLGRPDARFGLDQPGYSEVLELGLSGQVWMKVSGIYRLEGTPQQNLEFARMALPLLEQSFGRRRLVWGSDWPHTQHEEGVGFDTVIDQLQALECSTELMRALLVDSPRMLFGFAKGES